MQCGDCTTPLETIAGVTFSDVSLTQVSGEEVQLNEGVNWYTSDSNCPLTCALNYLAHGSETNRKVMLTIKVKQG